LTSIKPEALAAGHTTADVAGVGLNRLPGEGG